MSDRTYNNFRIELALKEFLPSIDEIRTLRTRINNNTEYFQNNYGFYLNIKTRIENLNLKKENTINNKLPIKLSADGTNIGKH